MSSLDDAVTFEGAATLALSLGSPAVAQVYATLATIDRYTGAYIVSPRLVEAHVNKSHADWSQPALEDALEEIAHNVG